MERCFPDDTRLPPATDLRFAMREVENLGGLCYRQQLEAMSNQQRGVNGTSDYHAGYIAAMRYVRRWLDELYAELEGRDAANTVITERGAA